MLLLLLRSAVVIPFDHPTRRGSSQICARLRHRGQAGSVKRHRGMTEGQQKTKINTEAARRGMVVDQLTLRQN